MFAKVMLKLLFLLGAAAALLLTAVPFISASPMGKTSVYLPVIRTNGLSPNQPPVFNPIPPKGLETIEDVAYALTVTAVDPDGDQITIIADQKPTWLTLHPPGNGQVNLTGTPTNEDVGLHSVTLRVIDTVGDSSEITFTITVINANDTPLLISTFIPTATEDMPYTLDLMALDPDGDVVTITVESLPSWLTTEFCGVNCLTLEGTPTNDDVGVHSFIIILDDGISHIMAIYEIVVNNTNDNPYFVGTSSFTATIGSPAPTILITAEDDDPSQDTLVISELSNLPSWLTIGTTNGSGQAPLIFNDTNEGILLGHLTPPGTYLFTLQVTDNHGGVGTRTYQLTIVNLAPQLDVSQVITEVTPCPNPDICASFIIPVSDTLGDVITLTVTLPNGNPINVDWVEVAITSQNRLATLNLIPRPGDEGESVTLWVRAMDSAGAVAEYTFTITVIAP